MGEYLIIEILGISGVGKSSLVQSLSKKENSEKIDFSFLRNSIVFKIEAAKVVFKNRKLSIKLIWSSLRKNKQGQIAGRNPFWQVVSAMTKLELYHQYFDERKYSKENLILDEGPLFWCVVILVYSPDSLKKSFEKFVVKLLKSKTIKKIIPIYLECSTQIAITRVQNRNREHALKLMQAGKHSTKW